MSVVTRIRTSQELTVPFPRDEVWAVLADVDAYPDWWPAKLRVEVLHHTGQLLGAEFEVRPFLGRMFRIRFEELEGRRTMRLRFFGGSLEGPGGFHLHSLDGATEVRYEMDVFARGLDVAALSTVMPLERIHRSRMRSVLNSLSGRLKALRKAAEREGGQSARLLDRENARRQAEVETSARRALEEAAKKRAEQEAVARAAAEDVRKRGEEEALARAVAAESRRRAEEEAAARAAAEEAARRAAEEEGARLAREEAERKRVEEEALARAAAEEARKRAEEEAAARAAAEEAARRAAEEEAERLAREEAERKRVEEEALARTAAEEARKRAEEEAAARAAAEEAARRAAEEEGARLAREEAERRRVEEEALARAAAEEARKRAEEEAAARAAAEEAARRAAEEEGARLAREEAERKRVEEEALARAAAEEARKRAEEEAAARAAAEEAARRGAEVERRRIEEEAAARAAAEEAWRRVAEEEAARVALEEAAKRLAEGEALARAAAVEAERKRIEEQEAAARAAAEEAARRAAEEEAARIALEEAAKKRADEEALALAAAEEARRAEEEAAARRAAKALARIDTEERRREAAREVANRAATESVPGDPDHARSAAERETGVRSRTLLSRLGSWVHQAPAPLGAESTGRPAAEPRESNFEIARRYLDALSSSASPEEIGSYLAPDVIEEEFSHRFLPSELSRGRDGMIEARARALSRFPSQRYQLAGATGGGSLVAMEVRWRGTIAITGEGFTEGEEFDARVAMFLKFAEGRIVRQRVYRCFEPWSTKAERVLTLDERVAQAGQRAGTYPEGAAPPPPQGSNFEISRRYLDALGARADADTIARFFAYDAVQDEFPNRLLPAGAQRDLLAIRLARTRGLALLTSEHYELLGATGGGSQVALEVAWSGVVGESPGIFAAGRRLEARLGIFLTFRDGLIVSQRNYDCPSPNPADLSVAG